MAHVHANQSAPISLNKLVLTHDSDAGRYPSLPRFLAELRELRAAENEAPDEGKVGEVGNALRIYTVHEAKGLEAPIVWLLDANDSQHKIDSYSVLLNWQPNEPRPAHFSLFSDKRGRGVKRAPYFDADDAYARREEMNLLYVAMTRAKQALLVSGNGERIEKSWYDRIDKGFAQTNSNPLLNEQLMRVQKTALGATLKADLRLTQPLPTGSHKATLTEAQRYGSWLHALMQHLALPDAEEDANLLRQQLGIPAAQMPALRQHSQLLLSAPHLARFFDNQHYRTASNEVAYITAQGEQRRIDRLVEFEDELWVLDYKAGTDVTTAPYIAQLEEYRSAMQAIYPGKPVRCALIFANGKLVEL